jgi:hypothetical protein
MHSSSQSEAKATMAEAAAAKLENNRFIADVKSEFYYLDTKLAVSMENDLGYLIYLICYYSHYFFFFLNVKGSQAWDHTRVK